ncbi:MAG: Mur ligase family protein [Pseudomonadota bacterium]
MGAAQAVYAEVRALLLARQRADKTLRSEAGRLRILRQISGYLDACGRPDARHTIHVVGTDGKGSTAIMVEAMLRTSGARTLLETSPHLHELTERVVIDGRPLGLQHFERSARRLLDDPRCAEWSFFDLVTVLGWIAASELGCDWQVLEAGIGGRLDTTNTVIRKQVAIITSIDLEHTAILGDTIRQIAAEKAAILRGTCDAVVGASVPAAAIDEVRQRAAKVGARVHLVAEECATRVCATSLTEQIIELQTPLRTYVLYLPMLGAHQAENAAAAVRACELALGDQLTEAMVLRALRSAHNPGRFEVFAGKPLLILDALHTEHAALRFLETVASMPLPSERALVFAALADKRIAALLDVLRDLRMPVFVAPVASDRSADPEAVVQEFHARGTTALATASIELAIEAAKRRVGPEGVVFVVGGVYTVAEARAVLGQAPSADAP